MSQRNHLEPWVPAQIPGLLASYSACAAVSPRNGFSVHHHFLELIRRCQTKPLKCESCGPEDSGMKQAQELT